MPLQRFLKKENMSKTAPRTKKIKIKKKRSSSKKILLLLSLAAVANIVVLIFFIAFPLGQGLPRAPGEWIAADKAVGIKVEGRSVTGNLEIYVNENWTGSIKNGDCNFRYEKDGEYYTLAFYVVKAKDHRQLGDQAERLKSDLMNLYNMELKVTEEKIAEHLGYRIVFDLEGIREEWFSFFAGDTPYGLFTESTMSMKKAVSHDLEAFVSKLVVLQEN
jgi:hypothetical protein